MMKISTSFAKRLLTLVVFMVTVATTASAFSDTWYACYVQVDAYPSGAGTVYADENDPTNNVFVATDDEYQSSIEAQFASKFKTMYVSVKPAEGWTLIGFTEGFEDQKTGDIIYKDSIVATGNPAFLNLNSDVTTETIDPTTGQVTPDDSLTVINSMPLDPNNYFRAIFSHVYGVVVENQDQLGEVVSSKLVNDLGDQVTLTARTLDPEAVFDYWTKDESEEPVSTNPELTVTVTGIAKYVAHFKHKQDLTIDFGEGGYYVLYDEGFNYSVPKGTNGFGVSEYNTLTENNDVNAYYTEPVLYTGPTYAWGNSVNLLYGKGKVKLSVISRTKEAKGPSEYDTFQWSGEKGVDVDTLSTQKKYYLFDAETETFNLKKGVIAPETFYLALSIDVFEEQETEAPATIKFDKEAVLSGIAAVKTAKPADKKGIYTLDGRRVATITRDGIYLRNGKKVVIRTK